MKLLTDSELISNSRVCSVPRTHRRRQIFAGGAVYLFLSKNLMTLFSHRPQQVTLLRNSYTVPAEYKRSFKI